MFRKTMIAMLGLVALVVPTTGQDQLAALPSDYRAQTLAYFQGYLRDPYSVRNAQITRPTAIFTGWGDGNYEPGVCVRFNAKNAFGAYVGMQTMSVAFRDGRVYQVLPPINTCKEHEIAWTAFPEMGQ